MQRVINFSGGKTSAYMTIHEYREGDLVIFCDTGREHQKTYKFINDFEARENIPIIRLQYEGGFRNLLEKTKQIPNNLLHILNLLTNGLKMRKETKKLGGGYQYFPDITMKQMRDIASQNLFKGTDLTQLSPAFDCACTS